MLAQRRIAAEQFLAEAARVLALSLDYDATIAGLAQLAVPTFADWCFVDIVSDDGEAFDRVAIGHHLPSGAEVARALKRRFPLRMDEPVGVALAVSERRALLLRDIGEDFVTAVARSEEDLAIVRELRMRSAVIAPMFARGRPIGALSLLLCEQNYDEADLWFVSQLAHNASAAIDNARLFESERRARIRVGKLQEVTAALSRASTSDEVVSAACRLGTELMEGRSAALWLARGDNSLYLAGYWNIPEVYVEHYREIPADAEHIPAVHVLRTAQSVWVETLEDYTRVAPELVGHARDSGRLAAFAAMALAMNGRIGGVLMFSHPVGHVYDTESRAIYEALALHCAQALDRARLLETERKLLDSERRSNGRLQLLGQAGEILVEPVSLDEALRRVARLLVPNVADWCAVDLVEGQAIRRVATQHQDPAKVLMAQRRAEASHPTLGDGSSIARVIAEGKVHFHPHVDPQLIERAARNSEQLTQLRNEGLISTIMIPLVFDGSCIGALSLTTTTDSGRVYDQADLDFAQELGRRAGIAIRNTAMRREIEAAHNRMLLLFTQAPMAIAIYRGREHRLEFANPTFLHTRGRGPEVVGRLHSEIFPEAAAVGKAALDRAFAGEPLTFDELGAVLERDGAPHEAFFHVSYVALRNERGETDRVMSVSFEVTDRVLARRALDAARREADGANRAKDDFLAMLGHELRNPLAPIMTALNLMDLRGVAGAERERSVITRQVQHLTRLVDDLLDVSRISRGKIELIKEQVELSEVVSRALETASPLFEQRNQYVHVTVPRHGLLLDADLSRLTQALSNLLTNASKYTDPGGHISITAEPEVNEVVLKVSDDGAGIRNDMLEQIFDLFVQEKQAIDRARGGLGLGLAIVKSVITLHGGQVSANSPGPGRGSVFSVRLPLSRPTLAPSTSVPAPGPHDQSAPRSTRCNVLVVDDNEDAAEMLTIALRAAGHTAREAFDGPSALKILESFDADVALLDLGLPAMDGYELASRIAAVKPSIRLVALTGYGQESDRERTRSAGFHEHLVKPIDIARVLAAISR